MPATSNLPPASRRSKSPLHTLTRKSRTLHSTRAATARPPHLPRTILPPPAEPLTARLEDLNLSPEIVSAETLSGFTSQSSWIYDSIPAIMTSDSHLGLSAAPFHTTRWSRVCLAKADSEHGRRALADLCEIYYLPVVAYLGHELRDPEAAREMSHAFFAEMLAGGTIRTADERRGRFRSYLFGAVKHFVFRQREIRRSLKRGAGHQPVSMDDEGVADVPDGNVMSPDAAFDLQWALTTLERALEALRAECRSEGKASIFDHIRPMLTGDAAYGDQAAAAAACGMGIEAFRVALHRMKRRLRQCVKAEVAGTLEDAEAVADEMRILFEALGGSKRL